MANVKLCFETLYHTRIEPLSTTFHGRQFSGREYLAHRNLIIRLTTPLPAIFSLVQQLH